MGRFDDEDLYAALDYLEQPQQRIEDALQARSPVTSSRAVFLYDVTSVYFEDQHNKLAEFGHERYLDLTRVEQDFRTLKTGLLEIRPVFVREARRGDTPS